MKDKLRSFLKYFLIFGAVAGAVSYILLAPMAETEPDYEKDTFLMGIRAAGVELGGKTYAEARELMKEKEAELSNELYLELAHGDEVYPMTAQELSVSFDTEEVLRKAFALGKSGSPLERRRIRRETAANGREYALSYKTGEVSAERVDEICSDMAREPVDAGMQFSAEENFTYSHEKTGIEADREALMKEIESACEEGLPAKIEIPTKEIPAEITLEQLKRETVLRVKYSTSFAEEPYNDKDRVANIKKSVNLFNRSEKNVLDPGEKLSLNEVLGDRTEEGGWKLAPGYIYGRTEDQPGGGVCQVSTTLYGAALKADLKIVERKNHSIPVGYAEKGLDATISTGGLDLVIENNTEGRIYLRAWISAEQKLYFEIYGKPFDGFDEIRLDTELVREIEPEGEMEIVTDETMTADEEEIVVKRRKGSEWKTYKIYREDGKEVRRVLADTSVYKAYNGEKKVGIG